LQTQIVAGEKAVTRAVELLRAGEIVALPTETVYGLAADAGNADAVAKIFEAKERPRFDPLIVHLPSGKSLDDVAVIESEVVRKLVEKYCPGPLTIVLKKRELVPEIVTAGLDTVAVRMSAHPVFQQIVSELGRPLAAPSANRFGRISPTAASHAFDELAGRIPLIVDGGATTHGIESTIIRVIADEIQILREGPITRAMLRKFAPVAERSEADCSATAPLGCIIAPGQLPTHYAPRTKLMLVDDIAAFSPPAGKRVGALTFVAQRSPSNPAGLTVLRQLSARGNLREAAANLFRVLRELDAAGLDLIVAEKVPDQGIGVAINDRLRRASAR
jgi:L-threonylcarbamoyladenylate synthase